MGDHPEIAFVQASGFTRGRPDGPPLWIVIHDMEADETPNTAEGTANYFATGAGGRDVSAHYCADNDSVVQCVLLADTAWTVGNRPGNYRGINWELAGYAAQTREQWLDDFGRAMFARIVPILRADAARFDIPLERRTVDELRALVPGVTSHNDLRLAFGVTDHTDPGPNFPWDQFMAMLNGLSTVEGKMYTLVWDDKGKLWLCDGMLRRHVDGNDELANLRFMASQGAIQLWKDPATRADVWAGGAPGITDGEPSSWGVDIATLVGGGAGGPLKVSLTGTATP